MQPGEVLMREGERSEEAYEVLDGSFEVIRGPGGDRIDVCGPGDVVGEIAMLAGVSRTATVRALEPSRVRAIDRGDYERWIAADQDRRSALIELARSRIDRHRLLAMIEELLGVPATVAADVATTSEWRHLAGGAVLFAEGEPSDAAYLVVSGRLAVSTGGARLAEVARGEVVGELGLIDDAPRSATVLALRDCTLARFDGDAFRALASAHPALLIEVSRRIMSRLTRPNVTTDRARSVTVAVAADLDRAAVAVAVSDVTTELGRHGTVRHLTASSVDAALGRDGVVEDGSPLTGPALAEHLQDAETTHDYLLLEADRPGSRWTRLAMTLADRVVVVVSAQPDGAELARADAFLAVAPDSARVERWLAVVHPADATRPSGSAALAARLGVERVAHVRAGSGDDLGRLARLVSGTATGLVLGGGGARGFAHLGVWRALAELGVTVDAIGGASIGAPLGVLMALQVVADEIEATTTRLFHGLLDYTVPVVSLLKGERIARNITSTLAGLDLRDTWHPFFCVSTNLTRSHVEVHDRGDAATAIRASVAIPGVLPPVPYGGDLLVDGGVLNNLPCDVMKATGMVSTLIAVDLSPPVGLRAADDYGLSVSGWRALRAHLGSGGQRFPGIVAVIMRAMVAGSVRERDRMLADGSVDCHLALELAGVQLLDFERVAEIAGRGYAAARPQLEGWLRGG